MSLSKKAMLSTLGISIWYARRLDKDVTDEVNQSHGAVSDAGRYNKLLVRKEALEPVNKIANEARLLHLKMTQPWVDQGPRILPAALYVKYTDALAKLKDEFAVEADKFCRDYPKHVEQRKAELNGLFRSEDYPHPNEIRGLFDFRVHILPCPEAGDFRVELAEEHAEDIRNEIEQRMKEALNEAMQEPVRRVLQIVGRMSERLKAYSPAIQKGERSSGIFRDSLVANVEELADLLPAFNLTGNKDLDRIAKRMKKELCRHDAKELREDSSARYDTARAADEILKQAEALMA